MKKPIKHPPVSRSLPFCSSCESPVKLYAKPGIIRQASSRRQAVYAKATTARGYDWFLQGER